MRGILALLLALGLAGPALALDLPLPQGAEMTASDEEALDSLSLPVGPWQDGKISVKAAEGAVLRQAWMLKNTRLTALQIIAPLREALVKAGYDILYECRDSDCGGFDFRYQLPLLPEPDMHVDLGDYRYLIAENRAGGAPDIVSLTVSRSTDAGYIHITRVGAPTEAAAPDVTTVPVPVETAPAATPDAPQTTLATTLETEGHAVLDDLVFATGSATLEDRLFPSLVALAEWLNARPAVRVALVGHSDTVGALDENIALSKARARSVASRLTDAHGVPAGQMDAEGVGYLAPLATNATPEGRAQNRRVEVVVVSN